MPGKTCLLSNAYTTDQQCCAPVQDLALLERLWGAAAEWDSLYAGWKGCQFSALDVDIMQSAAVRTEGTLQSLAPDIQAWPALAWMQVWLHPMSLHNIPV